jgi:hypothetical protein
MPQGARRVRNQRHHGPWNGTATNSRSISTVSRCRVIHSARSNFVTQEFRSIVNGDPAGIILIGHRLPDLKRIANCKYEIADLELGGIAKRHGRQMSGWTRITATSVSASD